MCGEYSGGNREFSVGWAMSSYDRWGDGWSRMELDRRMNAWMESLLRARRRAESVEDAPPLIAFGSLD